MVPFASGCGALQWPPANATGLGALAAAPPTPPAPPVTLAASRSPRLIASGSGTGRDATSLWLTPSDGIHAVSPGLPRTPRRGRWGPTPPRYFQVFNETEVSLCVWEMLTAIKGILKKDRCEVNGFISQRQKSSVKKKIMKLGGLGPASKSPSRN